MKHSPQRFALDESGTLFDYAKSRYVAASGIHVCENGVTYDLALVGKLIAAGKHIDGAIVARQASLVIGKKA